jgi:hypothetical protein
MKKYLPPKPSPLPEDFSEFYASLTPQEKQLHELAIQKLESSYFVQWTHMYRKWKKAQATVVPVLPVLPVTPTNVPSC